MTLVTRTLLAEVSAEAAASPRKRKNRNFHPTDDSVCHRLLNAIEPGSYVPPHRHLDPAKDEAMIVLSGRLGIVFFDEAGAVAETVVLEPGGDAVAVDIPHRTFHTVLGLAPGSVFFEAKAGPYLALTTEEKASWAPLENDPGSAAYFQFLRALFPA